MADAVVEYSKQKEEAKRMFGVASDGGTSTWPAVSGDYARRVATYWLNEGIAVWKRMQGTSWADVAVAEAGLAKFLTDVNLLGVLVANYASRGLFADNVFRLSYGDTSALWNKVQAVVNQINAYRAPITVWQVTAYAAKEGVKDALASVAALPSNLFNILVPKWLRVLLLAGGCYWVYTRFLEKRLPKDA